MSRTKLVAGILLIAILTGLLGCSPPGMSALPPSSPSETGQDSSSLQAGQVDAQGVEQQARLLTAHLIEGTFGRESLGGKSTPNERELDNFVLSTARYCQDPDYLYYGAVHEQDGAYAFSLAVVSRMLYEVFGIEHWSPQTDNLVFDERTQAYHSSLEFEFGGSFSSEERDVLYTPSTGAVAVTVVLTDKVGFRGEPGWQEHGDYTVTYTVLQEDGREFLRFVQMKSCKPVNIT